LIEALLQEELQRLRSLELSTCPLDLDTVSALLDRLESGGVTLRRLRLDGVEWGPGAANAVARALEAGRGGLGRLEELEIDEQELVHGIVVRTRAGAPCAQTLARLKLESGSFSRVAAGGFVLRLEEGGFPALVALELDGAWVARSVLRELVDAFVSLAKRGGGRPSASSRSVSPVKTSLRPRSMR
jgi:hypothetical protein